VEDYIDQQFYNPELIFMMSYNMIFVIFGNILGGIISGIIEYNLKYRI
jgi:formate/nitrite transporter FocA (FNT family)